MALEVAKARLQCPMTQRFSGDGRKKQSKIFSRASGCSFFYNDGICTYQETGSILLSRCKLDKYFLPSELWDSPTSASEQGSPPLLVAGNSGAKCSTSNANILLSIVLSSWVQGNMLLKADVVVQDYKNTRKIAKMESN